MTLVIIVIIAALLYLLAYVGRRRFGILGLGLAAGTVLARSIGDDVTRYLASSGLPVEPLSHESTATIALILLPALVLLAGGPTYQKKRHARVGAAFFAALGVLLILGPLTADLPTFDSDVRTVLETTAQWQDVIIAIGIALAMMDVLMYKPPKEDPKK